MINPYGTPDNFRAYVYSQIVLAWETQYKHMISPVYAPKTLEAACPPLQIMMLDTLDKVEDESKKQGNNLNDEFLVFHRATKGYECLFKRLRDTFAHGHYTQQKSDLIEIMHKYQGTKDKTERIRIFGQLKITTLESLVSFLKSVDVNTRNMIQQNQAKKAR